MLRSQQPPTAWPSIVPSLASARRIVGRPSKPSLSMRSAARALGSTPALAAARSSYRPAAKAHERIAELLPLPSRTDPPCSHRFRVALDGTRSPYAAMSSSSQGAVFDPMDTTSHPSPGSQGNEPPPPPGPRDEAGAADGGHRPGPRHQGLFGPVTLGMGRSALWRRTRRERFSLP